MSNGDSEVRFADGFDRPDTLAFGLEAPQLAVAVAGALVAWALLRGSAPAVLTVPAAGSVALAAAVLGCGRWAGRPLVTWAWLAARFYLRPRSGGSATHLLLGSDDNALRPGGDVAEAGAEPASELEAADPTGAGDRVPGPPATTLAGGGDTGDDQPPWARWLSNRGGGGPRSGDAGDTRGHSRLGTDAGGTLPRDAPNTPPPPAEPALQSAEPPITKPGSHTDRASWRAAPTASGAAPLSAPGAAGGLARHWRRLRHRSDRARALEDGAAALLPGAAEAAPPHDDRAPTPPPRLSDDGLVLDRGRVPLVLLPQPVGAGDDQRDENPDRSAAPYGDGEHEDSASVPATVIPLRVPTAPRENAALGVAEAARDHARGLSAPSQPADIEAPFFAGATRRLTFFSLNGGAGCTTLATEVACLLAARGRHRDASGATQPLRVVLLDLDLRSANVAIRLGIPQPTLLDYLVDGGGDPDTLDRYLVGHRSGLHALLGPPKPMSGATALEPARVAEMVHRLERAGTHFLVIDVGADLGAVSTWVLSAVHDIFVVITATAVGIQDAYRTTEQLRRLGLGHKLRYVVNRARDGVDVDEVMGDLGGNVAASIPYDVRVEEAENQHRSAALEGRGPAAEGLARLAAAVYPAVGPPPRRARFGLRGWRRVG